MKFSAPLRVVLMGTPEFSLPALNALSTHHKVVGVYTQPDRPVGRGLELRASPVKEKALELGLPVFQPEKLTAPGEFEKIQALNPDIIVVVAYGQILKKTLLDLPRMGCVNIHSSLLPRWRGAAPIQRAILEGDFETGVTTMKMAVKLDAGDILLQTRTKISSQDTAQTVHDRLAQMSHDLILETLNGLASGFLQGVPQNEISVTYAEKLTKEMEWLDPARSALELDRQVRALTPWPGSSVRVGEARLKVKQARVSELTGFDRATLFEKSGRLYLGTVQGALELIKVQWEGKKEVDVSGFINGLQGRGQTLPLRITVGL